MAQYRSRFVAPIVVRKDVDERKKGLERALCDNFLDGMRKNRLRIDPDVIPRIMDMMETLKGKNGLLSAIYDQMDEKLPS